MVTSGGHSNLGKMKNVTDRLHNFRFYEDRYPCRGGGTSRRPTHSKWKEPKTGVLYLICLPAQRGT